MAIFKRFENLNVTVAEDHGQVWIAGDGATNANVKTAALALGCHWDHETRGWTRPATEGRFLRTVELIADLDARHLVGAQWDKERD